MCFFVRDRYPRYLATCYKDKTNLNKWMVSNGYAVAYKKYSKKFEKMKSLQKKISGLWQGEFLCLGKWRRKINDLV